MSPSVGGAASGTANQGTNNLAPGIGGGLAIGLSNMVAGQTLGPIVGGTVGGYAIREFTDASDSDADNVTQFGMMLGVANAFNGGMASGNSGGGSRRVK